MRAYKFRLYPSRVQEAGLCKHLWLAKSLWNELLGHSKKFYSDFGFFPSKDSLQLMVKNYGLYSQVQQEVAHRVHGSVMRVFRLRKKGVKSGFPRFKSLDRMKSLYYPQFGFSLERKLEVTPFGKISIRKHREINGKIKTLVLKREPSGKWFAIFTVEEGPKNSRKNFGEAVGVDMGLKTFATLSNGVEINNPRHLKKRAEELALVQRRLSRKKKGSGNRRKAKLRVARMHERISNARNDFLHKLSKQLVGAYSVLALEKLSSQQMAGQAFGKQINDAGWKMFAGMLCYKAEEAGCKVVFVNPENTTKTCSNCGSIQNMPLQERTYDCTACGLIIDRDLNAARNILVKATVGTTESNASGDKAIALSMKEDATTICLRQMWRILPEQNRACFSRW